MKIFKKLAVSCAFALSFGISTGANALIVKDTNDDVKYLVTGQSYSFTHNILNDGYNPAVHGIRWADLKLALYDTNDFLGDDKWNLNIGLNQKVSGGDIPNNIFSYSFYDFELTAQSLLDLADGKITTILKATRGNFWFKGSELTAEVPEPGMLGLLGLGLFGVFAARRRKA